jgi:hypothetical protein
MIGDEAQMDRAAIERWESEGGRSSRLRGSAWSPAASWFGYGHPAGRAHWPVAGTNWVGPGASPEDTERTTMTQRVLVTAGASAPPRRLSPSPRAERRGSLQVSLCRYSVSTRATRRRSSRCSEQRNCVADAPRSSTRREWVRPHRRPRRIEWLRGSRAVSLRFEVVCFRGRPGEAKSSTEANDESAGSVGSRPAVAGSHDSQHQARRQGFPEATNRVARRSRKQRASPATLSSASVPSGVPARPVEVARVRRSTVGGVLVSRPRRPSEPGKDGALRVMMTHRSDPDECRSRCDPRANPERRGDARVPALDPADGEGGRYAADGTWGLCASKPSRASTRVRLASARRVSPAAHPAPS